MTKRIEKSETEQVADQQKFTTENMDIRTDTTDGRTATDKYQAIFNSIGEGFCIYELIYDEHGNTIDLRWVEVNEAHEIQTGLADVVGKSHRDMGLTTEQYWFDIYDRVIKTGKSFHFEEWHKPTGRWYNGYSSRIRHTEDRQVAVVFSDVTARKLMEKRQNFLLTFIEVTRSMTDPVQIQTEACKLLGLELSVERVIYAEVDQDEHRVTSEFLAPGLPTMKGRNLIKSFSEEEDPFRGSKTIAIRDILKEPRILKTERQVYESIHVRSFASVPVVKSGELVAVLSITKSEPCEWRPHEIALVEDVAERTWAAVVRAHTEASLKQSEERLGLAIEIGEMASWDWNIHTGEVTWNDRHFLMQGYTIGEVTPSFEAWLSRVHPDDRKKTVSLIEAARDKKQIYAHEFRTLHADGTIRWCSARGQFFYSADNTPLRMIGVMEDITDRKKNEEKLRDLNARLQESDKAKTAFFNNVSHEFRTPLTLIIGPLEELIKSGKSKLVRDDMQQLQFALRNATRLHRLVTALLDFARIEAGKMEAYYQPTDFSKVTMELAGNFRSAIEKAELKYVVKMEQIVEPIYLNHDMWEKIVFNLLSNAFKFTLKGKIEVVIREKRKHVEFSVKDTGVGIAAKNIHRIFDRFGRIEGVTARTHEGTGIGLALVRELVSAHSGVIKVKSKEGIGTKFIVSIPKGKDHFAKHQIFETRERQHAENLKDAYVEETFGWLPEDVKVARRNLKRYQKNGDSRVLVVEDNADMREYLSTVLSEDEHKIYAMEDGQKVISFLEGGGETDLIVSDVMMPVMDGFEMVKRLKSNPQFAKIPVVLLTAKNTEDARIEGIRAGADAYLIKPFSARELRAIVLSTLTRSRPGGG